MIYLNYFKNKYPILYENKDNGLPIQNISTNIYIFSHFVEIYKIDDELVNKIIKKLGISSDDLIIINKMKFYPYNLYELNQKELNQKESNINSLYRGLEKIILCLHLFHSNGLAHGDLKLLNIVSDKNDYKIIDFGGIKHKLNPQYECTCTCIYRSPEDYEFENKLKLYSNNLSNNSDNLSNNSDNLTNNSTNLEYDMIYSGCPLKSDIWSLGLVFNELVNKLNPIKKKCSDLKILNNDISTTEIENKIYLYFKKNKNTNLLANISPPSLKNYKNDDNLFHIYKINKIIEKMLTLDPNNRITLEEIYLNLFYEELPELEKYTKHFDYNISSIDFFNKFIFFRNYYYSFIKSNLENIKEIHLYPFVTNLFDRFLIRIINTYLSVHFNFDKKFSFIINLLDFQYNNIVLDTNDPNIHCINICYYAIYIISKLIILKKNINLTKNIYNLHINFKISKEKLITFEYVVALVYEYILDLLEILNYDIVRTKLFFYKNTSKELINKFIEIIENFNIIEIIKNIE